MDYKEKYKKALERARKIHNETKFDYEKGMMEEIFPELKESENKEIVNELKGILTATVMPKQRKRKIFAWLEKQTEQKEYTFKSLPRLLDMVEPTERAKAYCQKLIDTLVKEGYATDAKIISNCLKQMNGEKVAMATMDEQKYADKVEPRFKKGDWVVDKQGIVHQIANVIENVTNHTYGYDIVGGGYFNDNTEGVRLWTLQDAKEGDLIYVSTEVKGIQAIFHKFENGIIYFHCNLCGDFTQGGYMPIGSIELVCPLQKTQHKSFFEKMKEAGFELDAEKRELKKIEQKPADKIEPKFHEGDWVVSPNGVYWHIDRIENNRYEVTSDTGKCADWPLDTDLYHLWTIQDAKDGDVLSFNDGHGNDSIEQIKSITDKKIEFWFCLTNGNRYEVFNGVIPYTNLASREDATPATQEQRDLLFQKMKEAGYEWSDKDRKLIKIAQ